MELVELCDNLLAVLEQFDETVLPLGLYASDDLVESTKKLKPRRQEWYAGLVPYLKMQGYSAGQLTAKNHYAYSAWIHVPELGSVNCTVVRFSKIKVRKYGSSYKVDIHEQRAERWKDVDVSGHISRLWKLPKLDTNPYIKLLLLIGFDKAQNPLGRELLELQRSLQWEAKEVFTSLVLGTIKRNEVSVFGWQRGRVLSLAISETTLNSSTTKSTTPERSQVCFWVAKCIAFGEWER